MSWKLVNLGERDPVDVVSYPEAFKIAREKNVSPDSLVISKFDRPGVHGNYRKINPDFCREKNIGAVRSLLPSPNATYFDSSIFFCWVVYHPPEKATSGEIIYEWTEKISKALRRIGLAAIPKKGGNDVLIKGKKVSTVSAHSLGKTQVIGFSIIMSFNFEVAEKAIVSKHTMRETITGINDVSERKYSDDEVVLAIKEELEESLQEKVDVCYELTEAEREIVNGLREKYTSEQWIKYKRWSPVKDYGR
ncbi:hypothetical protein ES703_124423 [subsurface metagenome]